MRLFRKQPKRGTFIVHRPTIVKPVTKIEVKKLGLATGQFVRVRIARPGQKINIYIKEQ